MIKKLLFLFFTFVHLSTFTMESNLITLVTLQNSYSISTEKNPSIGNIKQQLAKEIPVHQQKIYAIQTRLTVEIGRIALDNDDQYIEDIIKKYNTRLFFVANKNGPKNTIMVSKG